MNVSNVANGMIFLQVKVCRSLLAILNFFSHLSLSYTPGSWNSCVEVRLLDLHTLFWCYKCRASWLHNKAAYGDTSIFCLYTAVVGNNVRHVGTYLQTDSAEKMWPRQIRAGGATVTWFPGDDKQLLPNDKVQFKPLHVFLISILSFKTLLRPFAFLIFIYSHALWTEMSSQRKVMYHRPTDEDDDEPPPVHWERG